MVTGFKQIANSWLIFTKLSSFVHTMNISRWINVETSPYRHHHHITQNLRPASDIFGSNNPANKTEHKCRKPCLNEARQWLHDFFNWRCSVVHISQYSADVSCVVTAVWPWNHPHWSTNFLCFTHSSSCEIGLLRQQVSYIAQPELSAYCDCIFNRTL